MTEDTYIYIIIFLSALVTYSIRISGFISAGFLKEDSQVFLLATYISYALVGALVVSLLATPQNALAELPLSWRIAVAVICAGVYAWHRKGLLTYLLAAVAVVSLGQVWVT